MTPLPARSAPFTGGRPGHRLRRTAAFSLVELAVTILIISIVAALGVPALKKARLNARSTAAINDLRVFAGAFQAYAQEKSDWPAATVAAAEIPAGMQPYLSTTGWERVSPIGGSYAWGRDTLQQGERYRAALLILNVGENRVTDDRRQLADIDRKIDDGNLDTGIFRLGFRNQPVFVIEH